MVEAWNKLPAEVVQAPSVNAFKGRFDRHYADQMQTTDPGQLYAAYGEMSIF